MQHLQPLDGSLFLKVAHNPLPTVVKKWRVFIQGPFALQLEGILTATQSVCYYLPHDQHTRLTDSFSKLIHSLTEPYRTLALTAVAKGEAATLHTAAKAPNAIAFVKRQLQEALGALAGTARHLQTFLTSQLGQAECNKEVKEGPEHKSRQLAGVQSLKRIQTYYEHQQAALERQKQQTQKVIESLKLEVDNG